MNTRYETEADLRRLAMSYAQAMDQNDLDLLSEILSKDVVIIGPGFSINGLEDALTVPQALKEKYSSTRHLVHNQTVSIGHDEANGETYSTASHIVKAEQDNLTTLIWEIRYQDQFRFSKGKWRICHREVVLDWIETRSVTILEMAQHETPSST